MGLCRSWTILASKEKLKKIVVFFFFYNSTSAAYKVLDKNRTLKASTKQTLNQYTSLRQVNVKNLFDLKEINSEES